MNREQCEGYDDPEDRCPRRSGECVCWQGREAPSVLGPQSWREYPVFWWETLKFWVEVKINKYLKEQE